MDILTPEELTNFAHVPETELVDLSIELDVPIPDEIDRATLLGEVVRRLYDLSAREGLPFSDYDREDLMALGADELRSVAKLCRVRKPATDHAQLTKQVIKAGKRVYRRYRRLRPNSQIPMYLPMLLAPLARLATTHGG